MDPKAKAKDLSHKAKTKDLDFGIKDQGQGQRLTSLMTLGLGFHFHVYFSYPWHTSALHGLPAIAELLVRPGNVSPTVTNVLLLLLLLLLLLVSTKAFSFHNRSSSNFTNTLLSLTMFFRIAPCRIFKLSPNLLLIINF